MSVIIELSALPLDREDWATEDLWYDGFCGWIADWVSGDVSEDFRKYHIESFKNYISGLLPEYVKVSKDSVTFKEGFNKAYTKMQIAKIKEYVKGVSDDADLYTVKDNLQNFLGCPFGTYIYLKEAGSYQLAHFLRDVLPGTYYFGATIKYHY